MIPSSGLSYLKEYENSIERQTEAHFPEGHGPGLGLLMEADLQQEMDSRRHTGTRVFGFYCRTSYTWWLGYRGAPPRGAASRPAKLGECPRVQCSLVRQTVTPNPNARAGCRPGSAINVRNVSCCATSGRRSCRLSICSQAWACGRPSGSYRFAVAPYGFGSCLTRQPKTTKNRGPTVQISSSDEIRPEPPLQWGSWSVP